MNNKRQLEPAPQYKLWLYKNIERPFKRCLWTWRSNCWNTDEVNKKLNFVCIVLSDEGKEGKLS